MTYLEDAAEMLRNAREDNERRAREAAAMHSGQRREADVILGKANDRRLEIAEGFTRLAAIEAGLPPCCHPLRQDPEESHG